MSTAQPRRGGKKNRKHGRNKKKPSMIRYNAENRCEKNKARRAARVRQLG